jgi:hypothetical protein
MARSALLTGLAAVLCGALLSNAGAQSGSSRTACAPIYDAVAIKLANGNPPPVPDSFLGEWEGALPCLVTSIESLKGIDSPTFSLENKSAFLSATGAMRRILARLRNEDAAAGTQEKTRKFIDQYRSLDNIRMASNMTYGARSTDADIRLNALVILGNTIDNPVLCVPLDHLHDPTLGNTAEGVRGRANLLAIVSVPAPWAFKENYANLMRLSDYLSSTVPDTEDFRQTRAAIETLRRRLKSQDEVKPPEKPRRETSDPGECRRYDLKFATKAQVAYP